MKYRFNKKSDEYLADLYESVGAKTWTQKLNLLTMKMGACNFSHNPTNEQKVACIEYELLENLGLYEHTYA